MINLNKKDSVADSIKSILEKKELSPKQKQIAKMSPPEHKIDGGDLAKLRAGHKPVKEAAKPDFLDMDKDGDKKEPMKQAVKQAKMKEEIDPKNTTTDTLRGREKKSDNPFLSKKVMLDVPGNVKEQKELKTLKKFKETYEEHSIYDQMIQEVLSKDASAGDWIHDFVHSDNPKFKGKSKEMRKKMALAAYYAKQRNEEVENDICPECMQEPCVCAGNHIEEDVEQIDEISKETLTSYASKAKAKANQMASKHHEIVKKDLATGDFSASKKSHAKIAKLDKGVLKAGQKLQKKAADAHAVATQGPKKPSNQFKTPPQGYKEPGSDRPYWGEEVEQIDELSKGTLGSYVKSATKDFGASRKLASDFEHNAKSARKPITKAVNTRLADRFKATAMKRHAGIDKAVNRLTKEESEQVEENAFDWKKPRPPESKGGSGVKAGRAYGGAAQKSKPEQEEEPKKKVNEGKRPETDTVPFVEPNNPTSNPVVANNSDTKNTPMSRVKTLAKQAMKRVKTEMMGKAGTSE